jgi:hypothetical protein
MTIIPIPWKRKIALITLAIFALSVLPISSEIVIPILNIAIPVVGSLKVLFGITAALAFYWLGGLGNLQVM